MMVRGSTGPILRTLRRPHCLLPPTSEGCGTTRLASTSRVTLGISKTFLKAGPAPSSRVRARSHGNDAPTPSEPTNARKPRSMPPPHHGRRLTNEAIDEARRNMQLRRMPYDEEDIKYLRDNRLTIYTLHTKETELQKEQKQLTTDINKHFRSRAQSLEKENGKDDDNQLDETDSSEAAVSEGSDASKEASAKEEQEEHVKELRKRARQVKGELDNITKQQEYMRARSNTIRLSWPNYYHPDVPFGPEENAVLVSVKDPLNLLPKEFDVMKEPWNQSVMQARHFPDGPEPDSNRDHLSLAATAANSEVDVVSGALATGSSWPYLLGSMSLLEHALSQYAMSIAVRHGFMAVSPPDVVRADLADRCGFRPRDERAKQTYFLEDTKGKRSDHDQSNDLCLAATAEIPLAGLLAGRIFGDLKTGGNGSNLPAHKDYLTQRSEFPIKLAALGHAFRAEAGARGADTRGLYRVHQFSKVEMFVATPDDVEKSNAMLEELRGIQEEVIGGLGLPYRVLDMPTEELGASAYRKYDIEVWMPGRGSWGEVSSASNCTNYQALRLGIRIRSDASALLSEATRKSGSDPRFPTVHTLNATAAAIPRLIVAILENHGVEDGKLVLPDTLKPFWLAGEKDPNVTWLHTGKLNAGSQSRLQKALTQVRSIAKKNGTNAPTMVASFLILHELTAIVLLVLLFYIFGALGVGTSVCNWLLGDADKQNDEDAKSLTSHFRTWARSKEERFERYCRRKGYLGFEKQDAETIAAANDLGKSSHLAGSFANMVAAYILVKALIPVRIGASVTLAGPFSRTVLEPLKRLARRTPILRKKPTVSS